jgi:hypothetical protein
MWSRKWQFGGFRRVHLEVLPEISESDYLQAAERSAKATKRFEELMKKF